MDTLPADSLCCSEMHGDDRYLSIFRLRTVKLSRSPLTSFFIPECLSVSNFLFALYTSSVIHDYGLLLAGITNSEECLLGLFTASVFVMSIYSAIYLRKLFLLIVETIHRQDSDLLPSIFPAKANSRRISFFS